MNDCIERAEAIRICERLRDKTDNDDMAFALNWAIQSIKWIPAEDVSEIVHCKDCKNRFNIDICKCRGDDWFCGYGERKAK